MGLIETQPPLDREATLWPFPQMDSPAILFMQIALWRWWRARPISMLHGGRT